MSCVETSITAIEYTDTWVQGVRDRGVDILWVRDDSSTMMEEQDLLLDNASAFITGLNQAEIDFRLAAVSTDVTTHPAGTLLGPVLTPEDPDLEETFTALLASTAPGSRDEHGIEAAVIASDPSLTPDFARPEADLELVFFSDEDDHGDRSLGSTLAALQNPRADGVVRATALVGDAPEGCASLIAAADPGFRYLELQEATAGLRGSICSPDYDAMLLRAGLSALGLTDRFVFSQFPDTTSLEVFVGEEAVPHDAEPGWTYEIGDNTLRFDLDAIPDPGVTIYATYKPFVGYLIEPDAD